MPAAANSASTPAKYTKASPAFVKYYLFAYNVLSTLGWSYVLGLLLVHVFNLDGSSASLPGASPKTASSTLSRLVSSVPFLKSSGIAPASITFESRLPVYLQPLYRRSLTSFARVGATTAFVQTFAVLEVFHVLLGWVRSPLATTGIQVFSRLFLVWGIAEQFDTVRTNPLYTSMVFAWSATEVVRYAFYACNLLGYEPYVLLYLRYTMFYVLYPLGAFSEAFLIYATLPSSYPGSNWQSWFRGKWGPTDYGRAVMFVAWWPGLWKMYTHMITQRRRVLGGAPKGASVNSISKSKGAKAN